jgi:hypothetical protein
MCMCQRFHLFRAHRYFISLYLIQNMVTSGSLKYSKGNQDPTASILSHSPPSCIILGFSKGGVIVSQLVTEHSYWSSKSRKGSVDAS